ncbi:MAG: hypothetical protein MUP17_01090 [candidate division Zixibacteria bacterium]|nr:hypothetical protein [candidate division Zixibacteria bacterium]
MRKIIFISAILIIFFVLSNNVQAENNLSLYYSPTNIAHSMDFAVRSNSLNYLYAQEPIAVDTSYEKTNESKPAKLKSPTTALVIALVPGSIVHGAGHFYVGKTKTAIGLFGAEIIGAGLTFLGALGSLRGDTGGESSGGGEVVLALGLGLFAGSWIYDVVGSPFAVKDQNDKILGKKPFPDELNMELDKRDQQLKCLVVKRF